MPKQSHDAGEQTRDNPIGDAVQATISNVSVTTQPVVICGVNRKANIGNFETIDCYSAVAIPVGEVASDDIDTLVQAVRDAADIGFTLTSSATFERYKLIKDSLAAG